MDFKLLFIFLTFSLLIISKSYFDINGYVSPDSSSYLLLADNLLQGDGFFIPDLLTETGKKLYAHWPVGYGILIALVAKVTSLSTFWASKLLNITLVGFGLLLLKYLFREKAYLYSLFFFSGAMLTIHSYTWSEVPFIFGLLWFVIGLYKFLTTTKRAVFWLVNIGAACLWVFFVRYFGIFALLVLGIFILSSWFTKNRKKALQLGLVIGSTAPIMLSYLYYNHITTGFITGSARPWATESSLTLLKYLVANLVFESNFALHSDDNLLLFLGTAVVQLLLFLPLLLLLKKHKNTLSITPLWKDKLVQVLGLTTIIYLGALISLRWVKFFVMFSYRTLTPISFLLFILLIYTIHTLKNKSITNYLTIYLLSLSMIAIVINRPLVETSITYYQHKNDLFTKYDAIPTNAVIAFGNTHMTYLRPDISVTLPHYLPAQANQESMENFIQRVRTAKAESLYIEVVEDLGTFRKYHPSVYQFMQANKGKKFIKLF